MRQEYERVLKETESWIICMLSCISSSSLGHFCKKNLEKEKEKNREQHLILKALAVLLQLVKPALQTMR